MRADICDADDAAAINTFRNSLRRMGVKLLDKDWTLGVNRHVLDIDGELLTVFSDAWSLDIEGPDQLAQRVLRECELR